MYLALHVLIRIKNRKTRSKGEKGSGKGEQISFACFEANIVFFLCCLGSFLGGKRREGKKKRGHLELSLPQGSLPILFSDGRGGGKKKKKEKREKGRGKVVWGERGLCTTSFHYFKPE